MDAASVIAAVVGGVGGLLGGAAAVYVALRRKAIEKYVAELNRVSYEHEVVFSRLHERRVDVVDRLYERICRAERAFSSLIQPLQLAGEPSQGEKGQAAADAGNEFLTYFLEHRIWLDATLCETITTFNEKLRRAMIDFEYKDRVSPQPPERDLWMKAWKAVDQDASNIRQSIESEFRRLLGVAVSDAQPGSGSIGT